mgnify:CR=1 FL=1
MDVKTVFDGYWLWFLSKEKPPYPITGKYLFFSENLDTLKEIALEEIRNNGFHHAKVNLRLIGNSTEHVLCLYYKDDSRKHELAQKYRGKVKYRYYKSDEDTLRGKYSEEFLSKLDTRQRREFQRVKR